MAVYLIRKKLGQDSPYAFPWGVIIVGRVFRKQFDYPLSGAARDFGIYISEGATTVNGKTECFCCTHVLRANRV